MVIKSLISGRVRFGSLPAAREKSKRRKGSFDRVIASKTTALDSYGVTRQSEASGRDTGRPSLFILIADQSVLKVRFFEEVGERFLLNLIQHCVIGWTV
jgi:hypothetical protein